MTLESAKIRKGSLTIMEHYGLSEEFLTRCKQQGIHQHSVLPIENILFSDEVRQLCAVNQCGCYGKTWACPPGVGTVAECKEACQKYRFVYIFSTLHPLEDSFDFEGMMNGKDTHEEICARIGELFKEEFPNCLMLTSEGCKNCTTCTYPDAPCRFPEKMHPSVESYGISVVKEAETAGINYINGANTVTYFGNIFF